MKQILSDLWQTQAEHPFSGVTTHAYLLTRSDGNILFCNTGVMEELDAIREQGGMVRQYLSHRHEAGRSLVKIKEAFGSKLCCDARDAGAVSSVCPVDVTFKTRETQLGNIEVIPTPGHTAGSACYLYRSPLGKTYLFTGDLIFPDGQTWRTLVFPSDGGSASDLKKSLALLRDLKPDVVIPGAYMGRPPVEIYTLSEDKWHAIVDGAIERV